MLRNDLEDLLNYHHLRYFWRTAREGSIAAAARKLQVSQPAISAQIQALEQALGRALFDRRGKRLVLTETGRVVADYAQRIFGMGQEMLQVLSQEATEEPRLSIGCAPTLPCLLLEPLLQPLLAQSQPFHLVCRTDSLEKLLADLGGGRLDLLLTDYPITPLPPFPITEHLIAESNLCLFGAEPLVQRLRPGLPQSLSAASILLPTEDHHLLSRLNQWFADRHLRPHVVGQIDNCHLLSTVARCRQALFAAPGLLEADLVRHHQVVSLISTDVPQRFYALCRQTRHPGVLTICNRQPPPTSCG